MGWFSPSAQVDSDEFDWLLATFQWIGAKERSLGAGAPPPLVAPTRDVFPETVAPGEDSARALFDRVRQLAGMASWPCELRAADGGEQRALAHALEIKQRVRAEPLGTFARPADGSAPVIRYRPDLWREPDMLIATFAHELAHYRMHAYGELPPGGAALEELATDVLAVRMGFGIFLANTATTFSAFTAYDVQGWRTQRAGYLSEKALVTALAIAERLAGRAPLQSSGRFLKSYLRSDLRRADRHLRAACPDLAASIAAIDLADYA